MRKLFVVAMLLAGVGIAAQHVHAQGNYPVNRRPKGATDCRLNGASWKWWFWGLGRVVFYFVFEPFATVRFGGSGMGLGLR